MCANDTTDAGGGKLKFTKELLDKMDAKHPNVAHKMFNSVLLFEDTTEMCVSTHDKMVAAGDFFPIGSSRQATTCRIGVPSLCFPITQWIGFPGGLALMASFGIAKECFPLLPSETIPRLMCVHLDHQGVWFGIPMGCLQGKV